MTDLNDRPIDALIDFDSDGNAYFASAVYLDTGAEVPYDVIEELTEAYPEELEEAEFNRVTDNAD